MEEILAAWRNCAETGGHATRLFDAHQVMAQGAHLAQHHGQRPRLQRQRAAAAGVAPLQQQQN